jgi:transposase-like protein
MTAQQLSGSLEAYVKSVSTRKVDDLVKALGIDGISKSEVSRLCKAASWRSSRSSLKYYRFRAVRRSPRSPHT